MSKDTTRFDIVEFIADEDGNIDFMNPIPFQIIPPVVEYNDHLYAVRVEMNMRPSTEKTEDVLKSMIAEYKRRKEAGISNWIELHSEANDITWHKCLLCCKPCPSDLDVPGKPLPSVCPRCGARMEGVEHWSVTFTKWNWPKEAE